MSENEEKQRLKSDMCPPQPSKHDDPRMHLLLEDMYYLSKYPKITHRLVFSSTGKRGD